MSDFDKIVFLLKGIYEKDYDKSRLLDIILFSTFKFEEYTEYLFARPFQVYDVTILTEHEVYIKNYKFLESTKSIIQTDLTAIGPFPVRKLKIIPDYNKLEIINSEIKPVYTEWESINRAQSELVEQLKKPLSAFEIKNVGNTSRTILKILANTVFKKEKHSPADTSIDISPEKYKNQLHSYIKIELAGDAQIEFRGFAEAAINMVDKAIILANAITHRNESEQKIAEVCVIGTIAVISIINFVEKR